MKNKDDAMSSRRTPLEIELYHALRDLIAHYDGGLYAVPKSLLEPARKALAKAQE